MSENILKISFGASKEIETTPLYRWNTGQYLEFTEAILPGSEVQYGTFAAGVEETINIPITENRARIPDTLLQNNDMIYAYITVFTDSSSTTVKVAKIPVSNRVKPGEYVSPEDPETPKRFLMRDGWTPNKVLGTDQNGTIIEMEAGSGGAIVVDSELSDTSVNPVQNKVITQRITAIETNVGNMDELLKTI